MPVYIFLVFLLFGACSGVEEAQKKQIKERNERKDLIHRLSNESHYSIEKISRQERSPYPWEPGFMGMHPPITKEAFRCKGREKHEIHGLFVYPVLVDILNYVQIKTGLPVVVTCGHRCQAYHEKADPSTYSKTSKHMIGAEVDFYVVGMESKPLEVIECVMAYYKEKEIYKREKEYVTFARLDQVKVDVVTTPWFNKEILIKLYEKKEGRDLDNQHPYPYISLQVRFDRGTQEKVVFSSEKVRASAR